MPLFSHHARSKFYRHLTLMAVLVTAALCWDERRSVHAAQGLIEITPVSAASFAAQTPIAPGSIAAIFLKGDVVPPGTLIVGNDTDPLTPGVQLPTLLENLSVEVHGKTASIFFLSARQWNILIPTDLQPGGGQIIIKDVTGLILAAGEIQIAPFAPALFTANVSGSGVPAAYLLRYRSTGEPLTEQVSLYNQTTGTFFPRPIDLERGDETVFLVLFLTGAQGIAKPDDTRVFIGGDEFTPIYVGDSSFVGVQQVNLRLPRSLKVGVSALYFQHLPDNVKSNLCLIEIAPPTDVPPSIQGLSRDEALAGEVIEITGFGFTADSEVLISDSNRDLANATLLEVRATSLKVILPFGSGSGRLIVRNTRGQADIPIRMRTSMSGVVQRVIDQPGGGLLRVGIRNVTIKAQGRTAVTNDDGAFIVSDLAPTARMDFEVDGTTNGALPFPKDYRSLRITAGRDNKYASPIELKESAGPSAVAESSGSLADGVSAAVARLGDGASQLGPVVFDPQGSVARLPGGAVTNLTLTVLDPGRVPANLPPAQFSSTIVQLTPFGATLDPGGRLIFPNSDGFTANEVVTLFRFDQTAGSSTLGSFVSAGEARVTADGRQIETASNAIRQSSYYFVSKRRLTTSVYGSVVEEIGGGAEQPVRGALVQVRGQSRFSLTDQIGTFQIEEVAIPDPLMLSAGLTVEVTFLRPDGTVDRAERTGVPVGVGGQTLVSPPIKIVKRERSRAPVILAPKSLTAEAGRQTEFIFLAYARVAGQTLTSVLVSGASFATVTSIGGDRYVLRLTPGAGAVGTYTLELRATDSQGEITSETILLEIKAAQANAPVALSRSIETNEDQSVNVLLTGSGGDRFRVVSEPRRGRLSGAAPNLVYTPETDFNGSDSFSFVVGNGAVESAPAVVTINVRGVEDAPKLTVGDRFTTNIGQRLAIVINGYDGDAGQKLTLTATGLPAGMMIRQTTATSWVLEWRPTSQQIGSYTVNLVLSDDGTPVQSASKSITIVVDAMWAQTSGPEGSAIHALAVKDKALFAGTSGRVYRTTDNGANWTQVNNGLPNDFVLALEVSGTTLFAGTSSHGVYRTQDNGANWTPVNNGLPNYSVIALAVSGTTLFAGIDREVYRTTDNGANWTEVSNGLPNVNHVIELAVSGTTLFAGTDGGGVFRTLDNGANWTPVNNGLIETAVYALEVSGATLFAGTAGGRVFRTTDNGANWIQVNNGLPNDFVLALAVSGTTLFAGTSSHGVYRTQDNEANWTPVNNGLTDSDVIELEVSGTTLFAGTFGEVFRTTDNGANWITINNGLINSQVLALGVSGTTLFAVTDRGVFRTTDNGANWIPVNNGLPNFTRVTALAVSGTTLFAGTSSHGVYRTQDNGANWIQVNNFPTNTSVTELAVSGTTLFAGTNGRGVYRTQDNGANWTPVNNGLTNASVYALAVSGTTLFAGTDGGRVYRTQDNGANWITINNGLTDTAVYALEVSGATLFAVTDRGVFRTTDNGANWIPVNNGLPNFTRVTALAVSGTTLFAGTDGGGVYRTQDNGANWTPVNNGLPNYSVSALAVSGTTLFAGTGGGGVFNLAESDLVWSESNIGLGNKFINTAISSGNQTLVGTFEGGLYRSGDNGSNWSPSNTGLPPAADLRAFTRHNNNLFAGLSGDGVYISSDNGGTWTTRSNSLVNRQVNALASDGTRIFAGTEGGVYRSIDNGQNWNLANSGISRQKILSLLAAPSGLFAGTDLGLFRSTNGGDTWTAVNTGLADLYIVSLGLSPDETVIFAGTSSGVHRSTNNGASWARITNGLPERVTALAFSTTGTKLLAGTVYGFYISEDNGVTWRGIHTGLLNLQVSGIAVQGDRVIVGTRSAGVFVSRLDQ